jgi:hypothetical protein
MMQSIDPYVVVTFLSWSRVPEGVHAGIREWFTEIEIVQLTVIVAATIAWNRVEMSFSCSEKEAEGCSQCHSNPRSG